MTVEKKITITLDKLEYKTLDDAETVLMDLIDELEQNGLGETYDTHLVRNALESIGEVIMIVEEES